METTEEAPKMFLLFEWTEEREAKMHLGIYSSADKARAAAQLYWAQELKDRGADEPEIGELIWDGDARYLIGHKGLADGVEDEDLLYTSDEDCPYDIEELYVDAVVHYDWKTETQTVVPV